MMVGAVNENVGWLLHQKLVGETTDGSVGCVDGVGIGTPGFWFS